MTGRPTPAGDDGTTADHPAGVVTAADEAVAAALATLGGPNPAADARALVGALTTLSAARLLVPVRAEVHADDLASAFTTAVVRGHDGRTAMLAFSAEAALLAWDPTAQPIPFPTGRVAAMARVGGAAAMLIDVAGPVPVVIQGAILDGLADDRRPVLTPRGPAWLDADAPTGGVLD